MWRVARVFFDYPTKRHYIREISRILDLAPKSVMNYLKKLLEIGIIKREKGVFPYYVANRESEKFKLYKKIDLIIRIYESGLLEYIENECLPDAIILFGSGARGEDIETSDIDICVISKEKKLKLEKFEEFIKRRISIFFCENFEDLSPELKNNIINGIILKGYLKVF